MTTGQTRIAPLDFGDWALHLAATIGAAVAAADTMRNSEPLGIGLVVAVSAVLLAWRRNRARHSALHFPTVASGEVAAERIAQLEQRLGDLEDVVHRLHELEERVEFAERLLARPAIDAEESRR